MPPNRVGETVFHYVAPVNRRGIQLAGLAGVASFVLIVVAALVAPPLWDAPGSTASAVEVAAYAQDNRGRTIAGLFIYSLAFGLFLWFAAGLWSWMRRSEPAPHTGSSVFAFNAVSLTTLIFAAFAVGGVLVYRPWEPELAQALNDLLFGLLALSGIPTAVCLGAYADFVLRRGGLPAWTGWLAMVGAIAHVAIAASFVNRSGLLSLEGEIILLAPGTFFAWILVASVALLKAQDSPGSRQSL